MSRWHDDRWRQNDRWRDDHPRDDPPWLGRAYAAAKNKLNEMESREKDRALEDRERRLTAEMASKCKEAVDDQMKQYLPAKKKTKPEPITENRGPFTGALRSLTAQRSDESEGGFTSSIKSLQATAASLSSAMRALRGGRESPSRRRDRSRSPPSSHRRHYARSRSREYRKRSRSRSYYSRRSPRRDERRETPRGRPRERSPPRSARRSPHRDRRPDGPPRLVIPDEDDDADKLFGCDPTRLDEAGAQITEAIAKGMAADTPKLSEDLEAWCKTVAECVVTAKLDAFIKSNDIETKGLRTK